MPQTPSSYPLQFGLNTLATGQQAVTSAAVKLADQPARFLLLKCKKANTDPIYYGTAGVTTLTGMELAPGETHVLEIANANLVYIVGGGNAAGVSWAALY